ncbi:transcription antitermination factor NusB [Ornithinibacillus gellani]|uniref:transcription antitermination factor NusB n=1 Tax=Ornithinibacillus gellani TaxID=2293253 RepID=UPI000F476E6F|nr:transcription antitermination factor NusB [Ornithinibacillus gellani]TQS74510.1 transcription antitermination factor NusB [Ornithinibacillus gellani]
MKRHAAREKAFQLLFQIDMNEIVPKEAIEEFLEAEGADPFLRSLVEGVVTNKENIDKTISDNLENWTIQRIASVEKTVIRIAVYEINYLEDIPTSVSINEAIELANKYGDVKSGKFVNGVLSKIISAS